MAAIIGALVCVLTGCLTEKQAYASIDWVTIFLFAGMMPVSTAMDKTGAGKLIAEWTVGLMGGSSVSVDRYRSSVYPVLRFDPIYVQHCIRSSAVPDWYCDC